MEDLNFFYQNIISIPTIAWIVSVFVKGFFAKISKSKSIIKTALSSGGMPSAHSCLVTSLTAGIGMKYGIFSDLFALGFVFSVIIIYDAINVRYQAGLHASELNKILGKSFNESLGHKPSEALGGSLLGIIVALILFYI